MTRLAAALALVLLLAGCGGSNDAVETTTAAVTAATSTAAPPAGAIDLTAYFLRDGKVAPARVRAARSPTVGANALHGLLAGPPAGLQTAIPAGVELASLTIDFGVAHPLFTPDLPDSDEARAQVVYTLTQFGSVTGVAFSGSQEPLTRADFEAQTPRILVVSPLPGDRVANPIDVTGTSDDTEAAFELELVQDGKVLTSTRVTASSGNGVRGSFAATLSYSGSGDATLVAYEQNAGEGPPKLGRVAIPVELG